MFDIIKPIKISGLKKRPRFRPFYGVVFSVILVFGLFNGFLVKNALAYGYSTNSYSFSNYIDNVLYYKANDFLTTNHVVFSFHVKTTFVLDEPDGYTLALYNSGTGGWAGFISPFPLGTYTAGQTYSQTFTYSPNNGYFDYVAFGGAYNGFGYYYYFGTPSFWTGWVALTENPFPQVAISFPHDNDELTGAFDIQGTFTQPAGNNADHLEVDYLPAGYSGQSLTFWTFNIQNLTSGTFDIPINGIPAGYYDFNVYFVGGQNDFYLAGTIHNLHIVNDIPPVLPNTTSTPPVIPAFPTANPVDYHAQFCEYGTSTTPLFNTLTGAVGGVITSIGQSLADFANKFSLTDAKNTGQMLANSVLTMREYVASLNAFFGDLPVGQILILYLITFVLVIIFRVIKGLVNLIKP
jgi:hypothetical protein